TRVVNFNRPAVSWAARRGKPVVGNCDVHRLRQMGTTYSLIDAERHPDAICEAIVQGRVTVAHTPLSLFQAASIVVDLAAGELLPASRRSAAVARSADQPAHELAEHRLHHHRAAVGE